MKRYLMAIMALTCVVNVWAQKLTIGYIYPAGGQCGTSFDIEIGGLNLGNATSVLVSGDGVKTTILPTETDGTTNKKFKNKGKRIDDQVSPQLADRIKVRVEIARNAVPGFRDLRLLSTSGVSNKLPFDVGQYINITERLGSTKITPTPVSELPATLCGQIMPGECDYFTFRAEKGTRLVAYTKARALVPYIADAVPGWFQAVLTITNSAGHEVAYNDDYHNMPDPVIAFQIPETDTYTLEIHDAIFRGREDFNYRIDLGEIPLLNSVTPFIGRTGKTSTVQLSGINLPKESLRFKPKADGIISVTATGKGGYISNSVPFLSEPRHLKVFTKAGAIETLETGRVVFDSLSMAHPVQKYTIEAKKNEQVIVAISARKLGSLLDARLRLTDANGNLLASSDDVEDDMQGLMTFHADPLLKYQIKSSGTYHIEVEDVTGHYGPQYNYVIQRLKTIPSFEVFVSPAIITLPQAGTAIFKLQITSAENKTTPMTVKIDGLPDGYKVSSLNIPPGVKVWEISVTAPEKAKPGKVKIAVSASSVARGKNEPETKTAVATDEMMQAFYYTHHIPAADFEAHITPKAPFSVHFSPETERFLSVPVIASASANVLPLKVRIIREPGFTDPVMVNLGRKMKKITIEPVTFLAGETEKIVNIHYDLPKGKKFIGQQLPISLVGTVNGEIVKKGKRTFENAKYRELSPIILVKLVR